MGRKADVDDEGKVFLEEVDDDDAELRRNELLILLFDVVAVLDGVHNGRVRTRPADALFFEGLDQTGFGVACRRLRKVLLGRDGLVMDDSIG